MKIAVFHRRVRLGLFCAAMVLAALVPVGQASAASCQAIAAKMAASQGGVVLSASAQGNKCRIKLLIKSGNGPPKRKTFVVSK